MTAGVNGLQSICRLGHASAGMGCGKAPEGKFIRVRLFLCGLALPAVFASCGLKEENNSDFNLNLEARFYDAPSDVQAYFFSSNGLFYKTTDGYYHYETDENGKPAQEAAAVIQSKVGIYLSE